MSDAAVPRRFEQINALSVAEATVGDPGNPTVVMLHGWGANIDLVWPLALQLARMGYQVFAPDLPGFGQTDPPPRAWRVNDYVEFILAYLNFHQLQQVHLFGHSFGASLGLVLGAQHANRIRTMVLADASGLREQASGLTNKRLQTYKAVRDGLKRVGLNSLSDSLRTAYNARYGSADFQAATGVMRDTFVQVVNEDLRGYAGRVAVPTLLLWGDRDEDTPLSDARLLEKLIPDAGLVIYEGAGHYSYLERTAEAARAMQALFISVD